MQTDARLCRFLISLSPTRSSSSVTAVTSHLNHPAVRPLPALIDAGVCLLSKQSQPSVMCGGTGRGVTVGLGAGIQPTGHLFFFHPYKGSPRNQRYQSLLGGFTKPRYPSTGTRKQQAQEMPTSKWLLLNMALQISGEFSLLPWQRLLAWVPTAGLCLSGKQLLFFVCSLGLESHRGNPAAVRGCERLRNLCSHKIYGLLGHKQHHSTAL